jgi:hypothetical protein
VQQLTHVQQRVTRAVADRAQRGSGALGLRGQGRLGGVGLHRDDAEAVRDQVVQLSGDPGALVRHGQPGKVALVLLGVRRLVAPGAGASTEQPARRCRR